MNTKLCILLLAASYATGTTALIAQTYRITDLGTLGPNASFATGINASGQVSGYSAGGTNMARAWRYSPGIGLLDLGSFGGADNRALGINNAGHVTGYSTDTNGVAHGFVFSGGVLTDVGGPGGGARAFPQHINGVGQVAGFSTDTNGSDNAFLFSPPNIFSSLGTITNAALPAASAAYGVNDLGRIVGIGTGSNNFNRAFRSTTSGTLEELGALGGDESWAYAINNSNQVVGSASFVTGDAHAFLMNDGAGMTDLGMLGGYTSTAFALDNSGNVVGTAEIVNRTLHAVLWPSGGSARDLNELIPVNSGWVLTEARGVNDAGQIVGNGLLNGLPRAFLLTPASGADTNPPVAVLVANNITNIQSGVQFLQIVFWDDSSVLGASISTNSVRVTGPNGFNQIATFYPYSPTPPYQLMATNNAIKFAANFYVTNGNQLWNGTNNGVYSVAIEPNTVSDTNGNFMPGGVIGTFTAAAEIKPVIGLSVFFNPVMNVAMNFTLTAQSSFPYAPDDIFNFSIDWNNDGSDVQNLSGATGTQVAHTFTSIGAHTVRLTATDGHGVASGNYFTSIGVVNPAFPIAWSAAPALATGRRLAVGVNSNGTLLCFGGLPLKSGKLGVQSLAHGGPGFADATSVSATTAGLGAGMDALNRIVIFGGIENNSATANTSGYVYTPGGGKGAAIASKIFATHDFAFCADNFHRLYAIGGAVGAGTATGTNAVERYDGNANAWTMLAPLPVMRVNATATYDGLGHILVIGGVDPATTGPTTTVYSYDIASDNWSLLGNAPSSSLGANAGRVAILGADGMVYLVGGLNSALTATAEVFIFDPKLNEWFAGPSLATPRGTPAITLGNDGFIYVMGGDASPNGGGGNTAIPAVEKLDTASSHPPRITSAPLFTTVQAVSQFSYQIMATGNPRPAYSLVSGPGGMTINPTNGLVLWTPTTNQVGSAFVAVRATSPAGVAEQIVALTVTPLPGDVTPPSPPTNIFQVFRTASSVTLTWNGATDDVGVASYNLYVLVGSRSRHWALVASGITNHSYIANGFTPGAIAAVDAAGNVSPLHVGLNNALTLPSITHVFSTNEPTTIIQGSAFLYTLTVAATPSPGFSSFSGPAGMTFTRVSGPNANNDYAVVQWQPGALQLGTNTFTAFATNANTTGNSAAFSVVVLPATTDFNPPTPVGLMTAGGISFDRCNLAWTPAGDNVGVVNYHLVATHFGATSNHVVTLNVPGGNTNTVLTGLFPASGYTVSITPSDAAGNIGGTMSIFLVTLAQPNVTLHVASGIAPGTLTLNWNGLGTQWKFTLESSDSLTVPNWSAVAPAYQWPSMATNLVVLPDPLVPTRFYRVNATPAQP
ncbi:MAG: kelch repeat-containing protein [Verrucomicrobiota bacterium]